MHPPVVGPLILCPSSLHLCVPPAGRVLWCVPFFVPFFLLSCFLFLFVPAHLYRLAEFNNCSSNGPFFVSTALYLTNKLFFWIHVPSPDPRHHVRGKTLGAHCCAVCMPLCCAVCMLLCFAVLCYCCGGVFKRVVWVVWLFCSIFFSRFFLVFFMHNVGVCLFVSFQVGDRFFVRDSGIKVTAIPLFTSFTTLVVSLSVWLVGWLVGHRSTLAGGKVRGLRLPLRWWTGCSSRKTSFSSLMRIATVPSTLSYPR